MRDRDGTSGSQWSADLSSFSRTRLFTFLRARRTGAGRRGGCCGRFRVRAGVRKWRALASTLAGCARSGGTSGPLGTRLACGDGGPAPGGAAPRMRGLQGAFACHARGTLLRRVHGWRSRSLRRCYTRGFRKTIFVWKKFRNRYQVW